MQAGRKTWRIKKAYLKKQLLEFGARNDMIFPVIDQSTSN